MPSRSCLHSGEATRASLACRESWRWRGCGARRADAAWGPPAGRLDNADRDVDRDTAATPVEWLLAHADALRIHRRFSSRMRPLIRRGHSVSEDFFENMASITGSAESILFMGKTGTAR